MIPMLLGSLVVALVVTALSSALLLALFPRFRSGERKEGHFRPDQSTGSYRVELRQGTDGQQKVKSIRPASATELPIVGGVAMLIGVTAATIGVAFWLGFNDMQWELLIILVGATLGFGAVGFVDDWCKVHRGVGITELQKFAGVLFFALAAAVALNRLIVFPHLSARLAYPPYRDIPWLGNVLVHTQYAWIIFFILMTATVATTTSLAVDFADGMDGLGGGLLVSAALSFAAILLGQENDELWPAAICALAIAGAAMGFLPFNWPSSWKAKSPAFGSRRARIIMGDTGSLSLGGLLALVAVISRNEFVLIFIGGVFVLEGLSALISARILVRFYRRFLVLERFNSGRGFAHTEFPLPFLATPMHHHFDLLNWDRKRLVYGAWLLGAGLGVLGFASMSGTFTWERYLARFAALLLIVFIWQTGAWSRSFFIGLARQPGAPEQEPARLALYYGFPFKLFGRKLNGRIDITEVTNEALASPAERLLLWQRMPVFDARAILGYICYRAGSLEDARRVWARLPTLNLKYRPEIAEMLADVRLTLAVESDAALDDGDDGGEAGAPSDPDASPGEPSDPFLADPNKTLATAMPLLRDGPGAQTNPRGVSAYGPLQTVALDGSSPSQPSADDATDSALWSATAWSAARSGAHPIPDSSDASGTPSDPRGDE